jgi:predicted O-linked N-acetylglucosamine transferase (SPINDLY family)
MPLLDLSQAITADQTQIHHQLTAQNFAAAIVRCQELLATGDDPGIPWLYGLATLLNGDEEEAQAIWMMAMLDGDESAVASWTQDLVRCLEKQADLQAQHHHGDHAWLIRQHIHAIDPEHGNNRLHLFQLALSRPSFSLDCFAQWQVIELLNANGPSENPSQNPSQNFDPDADFLLKILDQYLDVALADAITTTFVKAIRPYVAPADFIRLVVPGAARLGHLRYLARLALELFDLCRDLEPNNIWVLTQMAEIALFESSYEDAIGFAEAVLAADPALEVQAIGSYYLFKSHLNIGANSTKITNVAHRHRQNLQNLLDAHQPISYFFAKILFLSTHSYSYWDDNPAVYRVLQNQVLELCQQAFQGFWQERLGLQEHAGSIATAHPPHTKLRIGYICSCFYNHSVGWLARSLLKHHDPEQFDIYVYAINTPDRAHHVRDFYAQVTSNYRDYTGDTDSILQLIRQDEIDILVDLDSITRDGTCTLMALKPAPIQVTWLGWDAIGMSAIDYYIADPYVLSEQAQDYYTEKLWRLPESYIGLDGFEVGVPTLRRSDLGIPDDAVVFLNPQRGSKLHPETTKLQLQIVKQTPNSYFLVKGNQGQNAVQTLFESLAGEVGLPLDRLRFLPYAPSEEVHRANLMVADVVLDTFPFNGATTTLETLWMERPLVTLVGQQFAARNSYTMMMNAGITEGISWTAEEYVAWGVRLGTEPELRQQIAQKLRQAKQSAPLWNGKAFAQQMEAAYTAMYQKYLDQRVTPM